MISAALLVFLLATPPAQEEKPLLTQDELLEMIREAIPAVERAAGMKFRRGVWAKLSTRKEVQRELAEELRPQMAVLEPGAEGEDARSLARQYAWLYGEILIAKFAWKSGTIHIVPETIAAVAEALEQPGLRDRKVLRVIVTHELVHALDAQHFDIFRSFGRAKTATELEIRNALAEGHAQHVTRKVFEAAGDLASYEVYERSILADPPHLDEGQRYLASIMAASTKLAYVDGRAFFDALEKTGKPTYVQDVFRKPPATKAVLLKPERYYDPGKAGAEFDPGPSFDAFAKDFGAEWIQRALELDATTIRATFGDFLPKEEVEAALESIVQANLVILNPKREPQSKLVAAALLRMKDAPAAKKFVETGVRLSRAKDARMTSGALKVVKADYGKLALPEEIDHVLVRKWIEVQGQQVPVINVLGCLREFEFEIVLSNEEADDARLKAMVERLLEPLRKK
jgi:hypothetical protein